MRVLPNPVNLRITANGRLYVGVVNTPQDVPDQDGEILVANGWTKLPPAAAEPADVNEIEIIVGETEPASGDTLAVGVASSGEVGSGTAVIGVASLDAGGKVPTTQLPDLSADYAPLTEGKVSADVIPDLSTAYAALTDGKVGADEIPDLSAVYVELDSTAPPADDQAATLTNGPYAGNPTWQAVKIGGVVGYIPVWPTPPA